MTLYQELMIAVFHYYGSGSDQWAEIQKYGIAAPHLEEILSNIPGVSIVKNLDGSIRSFNFAATENITPIAETAVNSNVPAVMQTFDVPATTGIQEVTNAAGETVQQVTFRSGMAQAGNFVFGEVVPMVAAVSAGITLGKTVDKLLYSANPDFWDEHGMETLDPDTWGEIIGTDTAGGRFLNMILGTTPDNKTQAYIDQNALAYMALYMQNKGVFSSKSGTTANISDHTDLSESTIANLPIAFGNALDIKYTFDGGGSGEHDGDSAIIARTGNDNLYYFAYEVDTDVICVIFSRSKFTFTTAYHDTSIYRYNYSSYKDTVNGKDVYLGTGVIKLHDYYITDVTPSFVQGNYRVDNEQYAYVVLYGNTQTTNPIDGIGTQDNAKTPDLSGATTVQETLDALKQQYPQLFTNAVTQNVVQPDGTIKTYTYVPVATPDIDPDGNPISSTSDQAKPEVDPQTATESLLKTIAQIIQLNPPTNPPETGSGRTPAVVPAAGSASALYAIYNPTLSQLNAFGAWLWSDNFIEQIKKLFNDPMQAIIGLHKVYATPATSGAQNIKVGYLDSGVASNVVSNQYTTIDCGTVSLAEYFGNVFDYEPYTKVYLYLPFIGIVPLSVGEVMRSTINVVYHVDVLTGACLAEVKITRDAAGGTLFQYSGNAAVHYPISSGSYMGIISGIMSIAGGVAGAIATGGAAMPVLLGAGASIGRMHTDVSHSGSFSGNAGAMGIKKPYLIIDRPQTALAENFPNYIGYPSNTTVKLSSCHGFTRCKSVHVEGLPATEEEKTMIETALKNGVIIN